MYLTTGDSILSLSKNELNLIWAYQEYENYILKINDIWKCDYFLCSENWQILPFLQYIAN